MESVCGRVGVSWFSSHPGGVNRYGQTLGSSPDVVGSVVCMYNRSVCYTLPLIRLSLRNDGVRSQLWMTLGAYVADVFLVDYMHKIMV